MDGPSAQLLAFAQEMLARAASGRGDELDDVLDAQAALLRATPPEALDPDALRQAIALAGEAQRLVAEQRDALSADLGRLDRGRAGVAAYARAAA